MNKTLLDIIDENNHALNLTSDGRTIREVQVCGGCRGEGSIPITLDKGHSKGLDVKEMECRSCEGSGMVLISITITSKPFKPKKNEQAIR